MTGVARRSRQAALWVLLVMVAVSLYATFDVRFSLGKVSGVILGVLLFWAVTRWITTRERLALGLVAFLLADGGLAVIGLLGTNWIDKFPLLGAVICPTRCGRPVVRRLARVSPLFWLRLSRAVRVRHEA